MFDKKQRLCIFLVGIVIFFVFVFRMISLTSNIADAKDEEQTRKENIQKQQEKVYNEMIDKLSRWVYNKSTKIPKSLSTEIITFVYENCEHPKIILGIIAEESDFDMFAFRNDTKVYGLGQVKWDVWKNELIQFNILENRDLYDWKKNILACNYIFNKYYKQTKSLDKALSKYVGEINNDMQKYRANILGHIGLLSLIEGEMIKFMIKNKKIYSLVEEDNETVEKTVEKIESQQK